MGNARFARERSFSFSRRYLSLIWLGVTEAYAKPRLLCHNRALEKAGIRQAE
jgi:hypothetical protein